MANPKRRPLVVFLIRKYRKVGDFIQKVKTISLDILNGIAFFATPVPAVATVNTDVAKLQSAEATAGTHVTGSAAARDIEYNVVLKDVHDWQGYVQGLADAAVDEVTAIAIIEASGFSLKLHGVHIKPPLAVKNGPASGSAVLTAKAAAIRASYDWQKSLDGIAWVDLPSTLQAKTVVDGLTPEVRVYFRFRAITVSGTGNWSALVSTIVQ